MQDQSEPEEYAPAVPADVAAIRLFEYLDAAGLEQVAGGGQTRWLRGRSQLSLAARELTNGFLGVVEGECLLNAVAPAGNLVTLRRLHPGDSHGVGRALARRETPLRPTLRLVAIEDAKLLFLPLGVFERLFEALPALHLTCARHQAALHIDALTRIYELMAFDVRGRVLAQLLRLSEQGRPVEGRTVISPAPTHEEFGALVGASREAVTRHLGDFARDGLISVRRGQIDILDPERLRRMHESGL